MNDKLAAAAEDVTAAEREWKARIERRDRLVVDAIDEGMPQRSVAAAAKCSRTLVNKILAGSQPDAVLPR